MAELIFVHDTSLRLAQVLTIRIPQSIADSRAFLPAVAPINNDPEPHQEVPSVHYLSGQNALEECTHLAMQHASAPQP